MLDRTKIIVIVMMILILAYPVMVVSQPEKQSIAEEWKEIQQKYPEFSIMYIYNSALLFEASDLISVSARNEKLKELLKAAISRNCQLGIYPKCSDPKKCRDCAAELGEYKYKVNSYEWGRCLLEVAECERAPRICCD
jgi:hypothetical protein